MNATTRGGGYRAPGLHRTVPALGGDRSPEETNHRAAQAHPAHCPHCRGSHHDTQENR